MPKIAKPSMAEGQQETLDRALKAQMHSEKMRRAYGKEVRSVLQHGGLVKKEEDFWKLVADYVLVGVMRAGQNREHRSVYVNAVQRFQKDTLDAVEKLEALLVALPSHPHPILESLLESAKKEGLRSDAVEIVLRQTLQLLPQIRKLAQTVAPLPNQKKNTRARLQKLAVIMSWFKAVGPINLRKGEPMEQLMRLFMTVTEGKPADPTMKKIMQDVQREK